MRGVSTMRWIAHDEFFFNLRLELQRFIPATLELRSNEGTAPTGRSAQSRGERGAAGTGSWCAQLWDHPETPPEFNKRILRTVLKEVMASSAGDTIRSVNQRAVGSFEPDPSRPRCTLPYFKS